MLTLDNWYIEDHPDMPTSTYFYQNNIKVIKSIMPLGEVRCFIEVIDTKTGKTLECLANHHTNIEDALIQANAFLEIGV